MDHNATRILSVSLMDARQPYGSFIRPYYLNENLAKQGFRILDLCSVPPSLHNQKIIYMPSNQVSHQFRVNKYLQIIKHLREIVVTFRPQIIYAHHLLGTFLALVALRTRIRKTPVVADLHGIESFEQWAYGNSLAYQFWSSAEKMILPQATHIIVAADFMKEYLCDRHQVRPDKFSVAYNGITFDRFHPVSGSERNRRKTKEGFGSRPIITFTAPRTMPSNILALDFWFQTIPYIEQAIQNPLFLILGGGRQIPSKSTQVRYTGYVEDLNYYLSLSDVAVAPFPPKAICGGARNKVLEYWACQLPVVSTREGIRGITGARPDREFVQASASPRTFAAAVVDLIQDKAKATLIAETGYTFVKSLTWDRTSKQIASVLRKLV